jgi:hypothetical protein
MAKRWRDSAAETVCRVWTIDERTIEESDLSDGKVVKISRWSLSPDGQTIHARFDDMHGHIQEQDGHKVK